MTAAEDLRTASASGGREIRFAQMFNVRDLGGLTTVDGRRVRTGRVLRSDDPHLATDDDVTALAALGITDVVDLRTVPEVELRGTRRWDELGLRRHSVPLWSHVPPVEDAHKYHEPHLTAGLYAEMHEGNLAAHPGLWRTLDLATAAGPTVVHCASGRDRTGIVVALLLSLLGVPEQDILDDYAMSASGMRRMLAHLEATHPPEILAAFDLDKEAMVLTPPEAMAHFLDWVRDRHDGAERYVAAVGGAALVTTLRHRLLED